MRYTVFFNDCITVVETDSREEAVRYAQFNAGAAYDTTESRLIVDYRE